jgi:hypothetical protein
MKVELSLSKCEAEAVLRAWLHPRYGRRTKRWSSLSSSCGMQFFERSVKAKAKAHD